MGRSDVTDGPMSGIDRSTVCRLAVRTATDNDVSELNGIAARAVYELLVGQHYTIEQMRAAGEANLYEMDPALISAGTYYVAEVNGQVVAGSGWSPNGRLHHKSDEPTDDETAVMRATYVDPQWTRRGVAGLLVHTTETAATLAGFRCFEAMCTPMAAAMRRARGYKTVRETQLPCAGGFALKLEIMRKELAG